MRPYGFEPDRLTVREPEADVLREAAVKLINGDGLRGITRVMNEDGHRTAGGNPWQANVLRRVLMSPRVAGLVTTTDGRTQKAGWPAILDTDTYSKVLEILGESSRTTGTVQTTRTYLMTGGLAICGLCGSPLIARPNNDRKRGYVCASGMPYEGCGKIRINAEEFETHVVERVLARLMRDDARERLAAVFQGAEQTAADAPDVIAKSEERLRQIGEEYADGLVGAQQVRTARDRLTKRVRAAKASMKLAESLNNIAALEAEDLVEWWQNASLEQQRTLIEVLVQAVEVHPVVLRGSKLFDPSRIKIIWRRS